MKFEFDDRFPARPVYFGRTDRPLFGWLHRHSGHGRVGVVICPASGREAECSYRTLRILAESCSAAGIPTLRFDYSGTGESADLVGADPLVADWLEDTRAAAQCLRDATGVNAVVLVGLRFGAAIAALSMVSDDSIAGIVAIATPTSGRAYLRELKVLGATGEHQPQPSAGGSDPAGLLESGGYAWTEATQASIRSIDLLQIAPPRKVDVLLVERADFSGNTKWQDVLQQSGCNVTRLEVSGYPEMMLDPHNALVPTKLIEDIVEWLRSCFSVDDAAGLGQLSPTESPRGPAFRSDVQLSDLNVAERPVSIEDGGSAGFLFGIQSSSTSAASSGLRVGRRLLFLNAGAVQRSGPGRMYVELARRRASAGDVALRVDLAGIGDSPPAGNGAENQVYDPDAVRQTVAAAHAFGIDGTASVTAIGLCSGAYHALRAAIRSTTVNHVIAINPLIYLIRKGEVVTGDMVMVATTVERYRTNVWQLDSWKRIASGRVNIRAALSAVLRHRLESAKGRLRDFSRTIGMPWTYDLGWELQQLAKRGVRMDFIFSESDPGHELLRIDAGSALRGLLDRGAIRVHVIRNADHTFTRRAARSQLVALIDSLVDE